MATLWHECLHQIDDLFIPQYLNGKTDDSEEHKKMDVLANCIDLVISRNWEKFKALYEAKKRNHA